VKRAAVWFLFPHWLGIKLHTGCHNQSGYHLSFLNN
jgi:hypothetical protein